MMRLLWIVFVVCVMKCSAMSRNELEEFSEYLLQTSQLDLNVKKAGGPDDDFSDEDEEVSDHAWEESGKFEGDLILNDRQRRLIVENVEGLSRNGLTDSSKRWPDNELIYFIQKEHFNSAQTDAIERGIEDLAQASCVKFRPYRKGDRDAVVIQGSRRGCFAQVGYQGGFQVLNLSGRHPAGRGCFRHGTVIHELLHTLGFYHMQSSPDRDDYIDVKWENILQQTRHNFRKYNSFSVSDFGVGYDYDSVLHYSRRAFSSNGKDTLVPKQEGASIGQRIGLSDKDTQKLNKMYCDTDSNNFEADEKQKPKKKKKPKNLPFEGHGIGYQQGKTVVIKLPTSESIKLPDVSTIDSFDYFRSTPETMSSPETTVSLYGEDIAYPYHTSKPLTKLKMQQGAEETPDDDIIRNMETPEIADEMATIEEMNKEIALWESPEYSDPDADKNSADQQDESLAEAYGRVAKTVEQKVYSQTPGYAFKVNKDYSQFYDPSGYKGSETIKDLDERFGKTYESPPHIRARKPIRISQDRYQSEGDGRTIERPKTQFEDNDSSYRTSFPIRRPYSAYEQIETPKYATLEHLKDRQNYSHLYSPKRKEQTREKPQRGELPLSENYWYKKDYLRHNPAKYNPVSYTDYVMEHKSDEAIERPSFDEYGDDRTESTQKSQGYSLFGSPVPLTDNWYKPVYSRPDKTHQIYSEVSASLEDR